MMWVGMIPGRGLRCNGPTSELLLRIVDFVGRGTSLVKGCACLSSFQGTLQVGLWASPAASIKLVCRLSSANPDKQLSRPFCTTPLRKDWNVSAKHVVDRCPEGVRPYLRLIRADKPSGTWLLFWPCAWSIALAAAPGAFPDLKMLALFGAGAFLMRGAGCIINDMWDRDFDRQVSRTRTRPLASGEIGFTQALVWLAGQLGVSLFILAQFNWFSVLLGASALGIVSSYPLFKRFTYFPQAALGLAFNWGALLGFAAVRGYVDAYSVIPLYAAGICWTMVYDTIYAHQDKIDDALIGVKSTALKFGDRTPKILWEFSTAMVFGLGLSGYMAGLSWPFFLGLAGVGGHLTYQCFSVKIDDPSDCWEKFKSNHYLGFFIFISIVCGNLFRSEDTVRRRNEFRETILKNFSY